MPERQSLKNSDWVLAFMIINGFQESTNCKCRTQQVRLIFNWYWFFMRFKCVQNVWATAFRPALHVQQNSINNEVIHIYLETHRLAVGGRRTSGINCKNRRRWRRVALPQRRLAVNKTRHVWWRTHANASNVIWIAIVLLEATIQTYYLSSTRSQLVRGVKLLMLKRIMWSEMTHESSMHLVVVVVVVVLLHICPEGRDDWTRVEGNERINIINS